MGCHFGIEFDAAFDTIMDIGGDETVGEGTVGGVDENIFCDAYLKLAGASFPFFTFFLPL